MNQTIVIGGLVSGLLLVIIILLVSRKTYPVTTFPATTFPATTFPATTFPVTTFPATTFPATTFPATTFQKLKSYYIPSECTPDMPGCWDDSSNSIVMGRPCSLGSTDCPQPCTPGITSGCYDPATGGITAYAVKSSKDISAPNTKNTKFYVPSECTPDMPGCWDASKNGVVMGRSCSLGSTDCPQPCTPGITSGCYDPATESITAYRVKSL